MNQFPLTRRGSLFTALAMFLFVALVPMSLEAQGEGRGPNGEDLRLLELLKIEVSKDEKTGRYILDVQGKATKMPAGTKVGLLLNLEPLEKGCCRQHQCGFYQIQQL